MLLSSDHGFLLGEHHLYDKRLMYEPSIRVPMMLRYPRIVKPGTTSDAMVLNLDMAPTLLDIAGLPVPAEMQGKSMLPLAEGKASVGLAQRLALRVLRVSRLRKRAPLPRHPHRALQAHSLLP